MNTNTDHAWQAGIVDGEGCITISRQIRKGRPSPAFRATINVSNTDRRIVDPFRAAWGGEIYQRKDQRVHKRWQDSFTWHCPDAAVVAFLAAIKPFLRGKGEQADLVLEFIAAKKIFPRTFVGCGGKNSMRGSLPLGAAEIKHRESFWNRARALNAKGQYARSLRGGDSTCSPKPA